MDPKVLEFWAMGREGEVVAELLETFERVHPEVRIDVVQIPWTAAHQKLLTAFAGDATPDIAQLGNSWMSEFAAIKALAPLRDRVARSSLVQAQDYFPGIWDTNVVDGQLYGVPWYVDTRLLFYRKDLLSEAGHRAAPENWSDWMAMLADGRRRTKPERYGVLLPLNEFEPLLALALQQQERLVRIDEGRGNFDREGFRRALDFYLEIFRRDLAPVTTNTQISNIWSEFARGRFLFYVGGPWHIGELRRRLQPQQQDDWAAAPLPGPAGPGHSIAGGSSLVVFERSRHKALAWKLIEFLSRPSIQQQFHRMTGNLPPRRSAWQGTHLVDDPPSRAFRAQLERVKPAPRLPEWERIAAEMRHVAEAAVRQSWPTKKAVRELDRRADAILEKRRWMNARKARVK